MKNLLIILFLFKNMISSSPNLNIEFGVDINFSSHKLINSYLNISGDIFFNKMLSGENFISVYFGPVFEIYYFKKVQGIIGVNWILANNCNIIRDIRSVRILVGIKYLPIKYLDMFKFFITFKNNKKWIYEIKLDFSKTVYKKHHAFIRLGTVLNYNSNENIDNSLFQNNPNLNIDVETNNCSREKNNEENPEIDDNQEDSGLYTEEFKDEYKKNFDDDDDRVFESSSDDNRFVEPSSDDNQDKLQRDDNQDKPQSKRKKFFTGVKNFYNSLNEYLAAQQFQYDE